MKVSTHGDQSQPRARRQLYYGNPVAEVPLPLEADKKLRELRQVAKDGHAILLAAQGDMRAAREEKQHAELERRMAFEHRGPVIDSKAQTLADVRLQRAEDKLQRAAGLVAERTTRWNTLAQLVANLDAWLRRLPDETEIALYPPARLPTLKRGEKPQDVVERVRKDIARLSADLRRVSSAPVPSAVAKVLARRLSGELVERGRPDVFGLVESGAPVTLQKEWRYLPDGKPWAEPDAIAFSAWLDPDRLIARLEAEIDRLSDDEHALAPEDRQAQERQLRADLLAAERLEEAGVMAAAAEGVEILRRPVADPRAVLCLADHVGAEQ